MLIDGCMQVLALLPSSSVSVILMSPSMLVHNVENTKIASLDQCNLHGGVTVSLGVTAFHQ